VRVSAASLSRWRTCWSSKLLNFSSNLLSKCRHAGVTVVSLSYDMVDDELRVIADLKPLDPMLGGNAQGVDESLVLRHIVGHAEVQSNYIKESISLRGD
jgi:hypothetical protein